MPRGAARTRRRSGVCRVAPVESGGDGACRGEECQLAPAGDRIGPADQMRSDEVVLCVGFSPDGTHDHLGRWCHACRVAGCNRRATETFTRAAAVKRRPASGSSFGHCGPYGVGPSAALLAHRAVVCRNDGSGFSWYLFGPDNRLQYDIAARSGTGPGAISSPPMTRTPVPTTSVSISMAHVSRR